MYNMQQYVCIYIQYECSTIVYGHLLNVRAKMRGNLATYTIKVDGYS